MSVPMLRRLVRRVAGTLPRLARPLDRDWAEAMASESGYIDGDRAAAMFVLGCAVSLAWRRVSKRERDRNPPLAPLGLACGAAAVASGLLLMAFEGAPRSYLAVNALTGLVALLAFPFLVQISRVLLRRPAAAAGVLGALLLATAFFGTALDGVARWFRVGPVVLQISFLALPLLVALAARLPAGRTAPALLLAAAGLALQPDRAMAAALAGSVAVIALQARERGWGALLGVCAIGLAATFARPDPMPAVAFVDQVIPFAFAASGALGALIALAMVLPLVPFALGLRNGSEGRTAVAALGAMWLTATAAALLGNHPSPLVGYGASPILGYALSFAFLSAIGLQAGSEAGSATETRNGAPPASLRIIGWLRTRRRGKVAGAA